MKRYSVVRRAVVVCAALISSFACGDSSPFAPLGSVPADYSGASLAAAASAICTGGNCDGDFGAVTVKGGTEMDLDAALEFLIVSFPLLDEDDVTGHAAFEGAVAGLPPDDFIRRTYSVTQSVYCNSTGTEGADLGTPADGAVIQTVYLNASFNDEGAYEPNEDRDTVVYVEFRDCEITGDLLALGSDQGIRLDGSYVFSHHEAGVPSAADPTFTQRQGTVHLLADLNGDGAFSREFWGEVLDIDAEHGWDGFDEWYNGGACIGEAVERGGNDESDAEDGCVDDEDVLPEGFGRASSL